MARWLDYEKMIADIYRELAPSTTVIHNEKILGRHSQEERQIDVTIRARFEEQDILVAVQAKDYKRPADINKVGEFAAVIHDIGATKGILVCNAGFTKGAMNLARSWGIDLCSAYDAENRNWSQDISIPVLWVDVSPTAHFSLLASLDAGDSIPVSLHDWVLSSDQGQTRIRIVGTFVDAWNQNRIPKDSGVKHYIRMDNTGVELLVAQNKWQKVDEFLISYVVNKQAWLKYFPPSEFRGIKNHLTNEMDFSRS
jgi:Restriction endonuclease